MKVDIPMEKLEVLARLCIAEGLCNDFLTKEIALELAEMGKSFKCQIKSKFNNVTREVVRGHICIDGIHYHSTELEALNHQAVNVQLMWDTFDNLTHIIVIDSTGHKISVPVLERIAV